ncbi:MULTISPECIES: cation diffusion facilitator family transporter [Exiguobacterium]|uniref:Cation efflux protein n=1 Tax=Exiguobacterium sp. (strain ATCC BAA-1283 / AT1b) TaxID=360911 RepID=C4L6Y1_EXISA|nr:MULTISPECIES: cation transporter [unclassified Exiguobacterium]ACQ70074.1 cation efflux protein [Exiguobacterium sp. AT1b]QUP87738.1 cation transporter [Exiguobacterium sp. PFWT01]
MPKDPQLERFVLRVSVFASLFFAISGIIVGYYLSSAFILFDGIYSFLSVIMSWISLRAGVFMLTADKRFPFGKSTIEPFIILFQYGVLLYVIVTAFLGAIEDIRGGGNELVLGGALVYLAISAALTYGIFRYLRTFQLKASSGLVSAEIVQWRLSFVLTGGALVGYLIAQVLVWLSFEAISPYVDPVMLLLITMWLVKTPLIEMWTAIKELIGMNTETPYSKQITLTILQVAHQYDVNKTYVRTTKSGNLLFIEIDLVVPTTYRYDKIADQDMIRQKMEDALAFLPYEKWLTISFTHDNRWAE